MGVGRIAETSIEDVAKADAIGTVGTSAVGNIGMCTSLAEEVVVGIAVSNATPGSSKAFVIRRIGIRSEERLH